MADGNPCDAGPFDAGDVPTDHRFCRGCGYDLFGLDQHRCPECGSVFNPNDESTFDRKRIPAWRFSEWRWSARLVVVSSLYPYLLLGMAYATWFAAAWSLGRFPRPYADDPKGIHLGSVGEVFYTATWMLVMGALPAMGLTALASLLCVTRAVVEPARGQRRRYLLAVALACVLWMAGVFLSVMDPFRVLDWILD